MDFEYFELHKTLVCGKKYKNIQSKEKWHLKQFDEIDSEEIGETESIIESSGGPTGKFYSDIWNCFTKNAVAKKALC